MRISALTVTISLPVLSIISIFIFSEIYLALLLLALTAAILAVSLQPPRCANCGRRVDPSLALKWRGKLFCSRKCKTEYRRRISKKDRKPVLPASSALEKVYWRKY